ncbi:MAG TPA: LPS export ABC transporter periplasmic protein LptC [Candidatus Cybelea sp.]
MRFLAALALFGLVASAGCNPQAPKTAASPAAKTTPRPTSSPLVLLVTGKGTAHRPVHVIQQVHNRINYDLVASSYESRGPQNSMRSVFTDARVTFRDSKGSTITARAPQAVVDQTANTVTMTGGVAARTAAGMTLHCDRLVYRRESGTLHGDGNVVITDPKGFRATGSSFDSDISLTHMRMQ